MSYLTSEENDSDTEEDNLLTAEEGLEEMPTSEEFEQALRGE